MQINRRTDEIFDCKLPHQIVPMGINPMNISEITGLSDNSLKIISSLAVESMFIIEKRIIISRLKEKKNENKFLCFILEEMQKSKPL